MAWRPTPHLIEGELDNTTPGVVKGWMQFAGLKGTVIFDLQGNFHRDIRGAKIRIQGEGAESDAARRFMEGFALEQTGKAGDITAGDPPADYVQYPYVEVYTDQNGRIVLELSREQLQVIGRPIPACESDPISREEQQHNMDEFLADVSREAGKMAITMGPQIVADPAFTHWVVVNGKTVGEAHSVESDGHGHSFGFVRLFNMPEGAEYGYIDSRYLQAKSESPRQA